jgi:hypothetical protein
MNRNLYVYLFVLKMLLIGLGCQIAPTPIPSTPTPPAFLLDLPSQASIECPQKWDLDIVLWEHAARTPRDKSNSVPERGTQVGTLHSCETVEVLYYEWSDFKQEYWLLVDNHNGQRGWLAAEFVEFEP